MEIKQVKSIELSNKEIDMLMCAYNIIDNIENQVKNIDHKAIINEIEYSIGEISDIRYMLKELIDTDIITIK